MKTTLNEELLYQIYSIVEEIPEGKVVTYKQIAQLLGCDKNSRLIGKALKISEFYGNYPCHRVVNSEGRLVPNWIEQKSLLLKEGVTFKSSGNVNLNISKWDYN